jgi:hypothetical protein
VTYKFHINLDDLDDVPSALYKLVGMKNKQIYPFVSSWPVLRDFNMKPDGAVGGRTIPTERPPLFGEVSANV